MSYTERSQAEGPKRILALDGGGICGAVTLYFLGEIERNLAERHVHKASLKRINSALSVFDLTGGTSE